MYYGTKEAEGYRKNREGEVRVTSLIPAWLFDFIKSEAIDNKRSISAQVCLMLEEFKVRGNRNVGS